MEEFKKDNEIEYVLSLIEQDSSILSKLELDELEEIAEYLTKYKQYLLGTFSFILWKMAIKAKMVPLRYMICYIILNTYFR